MIPVSIDLREFENVSYIMDILNSRRFENLPSYKMCQKWERACPAED